MSTGVEAGLRWTGAGVMALHDGKLTMAHVENKVSARQHVSAR